MKKLCFIALTMLLLSGQKGWAEDGTFSEVNGTTITISSISDMELLATNVNSGNNYSGYTFLLAKDLQYVDTEKKYMPSVVQGPSISQARSTDRGIPSRESTSIPLPPQVYLPLSVEPLSRT